MGTYFKLNNENKIENTILAEKDFIETQPDKEKYIRLITNDEERFNSQEDLSYTLNKPETVYNKENETIEEPVYIFEKRKFKNPKPYASWIWNEELFIWEAPIKKPFTINHYWDEEKNEWVKYEE
jgi:hypothetical protein